MLRGLLNAVELVSVPSLVSYDGDCFLRIILFNLDEELVKLDYIGGRGIKASFLMRRTFKINYDTPRSVLTIGKPVFQSL